jgi:hypothetical protein
MGNVSNSDFPYSFGSIHILDSGVELPEIGWSEAHERQGFSRGSGCIQIATFTQFGTAQLVLKLGPSTESAGFERIIEIPMDVRSNKIEVFSADCADSPEIINVEPGHYRVVVAQQLLDKNEIGAGLERIEISFEKLVSALSVSRIIRCDAELNPPTELLERLP